MANQHELSLEKADSQFERSQEKPLASFEEMRRRLRSSIGSAVDRQPTSFADLVERFGANAPRN